MSSAIISECGKYRYELIRWWMHGDKGRVTFVMLNPSTADNLVNDPTIRRCIGYAQEWGYGSLGVVNTNPFRATNPKDVVMPNQDILNVNDEYVSKTVRGSELVVCAWGVNVNAQLQDRMIKLLTKEKPIYVLGLTKDGIPKHPLYLKKDLRPILWKEKV